MKKLLTILFSAGMMSTAFAQSHQGNNGDHYGKYNQPSPSNKQVQIVVSVKSKHANAGNYDNGRNDSYAFSSRERDAQLQRINQEFEARISAVNNNRRLRAPEKSRQIAYLENERRQKISEITSRYARGDNRYDNHYAKSDRKQW
jgi:hypothetical protein